MNTAERKKHHLEKYPWKDMAIGETFRVYEKFPYIRRQASVLGKALGKKFRVRTVEDGAGIEVERTK